MTRKNMTVYDIAREAGVSAATVSRVLTGNVPVSEKTRQKVMEIVDKYAFRPSSVARSLKDRRSKTIGFIMPDVTNPYFSQLYLELETKAMLSGYTVILCNSHSDNARESQLLEVLMSKEVEAIVMAGGRVDASMLTKRYMHEMEHVSRMVPLITCTQMPGVPCIQLNNDDEQGMRLIVEHMAKLGHRTIGMIGGRLDVRPAFKRRQYMLNFAEEYGLHTERRWLVEGGFSMTSGRTAMEKLLAQDKVPTAVLAINDVEAVGALSALQHHGISVPRDLSLAGYDGITLTETITPTITTVATDFKAFADHIIDVVQRSAEGPVPPELTTLAMQLMVRESTGAPHISNK